MNAPDQPGQHADERLRAAAEAGRRAAPDFALHPATRRMLVDEARRRHARRAPTQGGPWRVRWIWAWASGLALVATVLVLQPLAKSKARRLAKSAPPNAPASVLESRESKDAGRTAATDPGQEPLLARVEASPVLREELSRLDAAAVPAAPAAATGTGLALAYGLPPGAAPAAAPARTEAFDLATADAASPAAGLGGESLFLGAPVKAAAPPTVQRFVQVRTPAERGRHDIAPGVLERFTLHTEGGAFLLTDADGSVYRGALSAAPAPADARAEAAPRAFRVEGTNLTLRLPVVVTGVVAVAAPSLPQAAVAGRAAGEPAASLAPVFLSLRGTAVIGGTNRVEILAAPPRDGAPPAE